MPQITVGHRAEEARRRPPDAVQPAILNAPSPRGSTYWGAALRCPREHLLANVLGWSRGTPSNALDTGVLWHWALEAYYRDRMQHQIQCLAADPNLNRRDAHFLRGNADGEAAAFIALQPFAQESGYEDIYAKLERMLVAYFTRWRNDMWEIVDVEPTVSSNMRYGFEYSARLDLLVVDHALNQPVLRNIEHKSAGRLDIQTLEGYTQDLQTLGQIWLVEAEVDLSQYPTFVGSLVNVTSKTKEPGCERVPVQPSPAALNNWKTAMQKWRLLLPVYAEMDYPQNFASCTRRFGRCPYFDLCRSYPKLTGHDLLSFEPPEPYKVRAPVEAQ
jgi:hypothetical protein